MENDTYILGISGGFSAGNQDGAAALIKNNEIIAAVEEERLAKQKHARSLFPKRSILFCLKQAGITIQDVKYLAFHVDTYDNIIEDLQDYMIHHFGHCPEIKLINHHTAHAAMAYYVSGFDESMIITMDYSGDGISTTLNHGKGPSITRLQEYRKPDSLGIFYSLITQFLGFKIDSDEYKVMGLSAYGKHSPELQEKFDRILEITEDGYKLDPELFKNTMTRQQCRFSQKLVDILGPHRKSTDPTTQREMDIAYMAQKQFERACMALLKGLAKKVGSRNLCLAGGSSLNCVMNSVLLQSKHIDSIFVPPAAGDSGVSLGAALVVATELGFTFGRLKTPYLGPGYTNDQIKNDLDMCKLDYQEMEEDELIDFVTDKIHQGNIVGWFQGRLEFGARALGNRSILADPTHPDMRDRINKYIKFRETFRPFAPSVAYEAAKDYYENWAESPYMTLTFDAKNDKLPSTTHVNNTARVQTVKKTDNELYYKLISALGEKTGASVVLNTSLNIMGQPIVCTPKDALTVFGATGMDVMVLGNFVLIKNK